MYVIVTVVTVIAESLNILSVSLQKSVAEAMREMLETFRLPGESQQIDRIAETFAEVYFATGPGVFVDAQRSDYMYSLCLLRSRGQVARQCLRARVLNHHA